MSVVFDKERLFPMLPTVLLLALNMFANELKCAAHAGGDRSDVFAC